MENEDKNIITGCKIATYLDSLSAQNPVATKIYKKARTGLARLTEDEAGAVWNLLMAALSDTGKNIYNPPNINE